MSLAGSIVLQIVNCLLQVMYYADMGAPHLMKMDVRVGATSAGLWEGGAAVTSSMAKASEGAPLTAGPSAVDCSAKWAATHMGSRCPTMHACTSVHNTDLHTCHACMHAHIYTHMHTTLLMDPSWTIPF